MPSPTPDSGSMRRPRREAAAQPVTNGGTQFTAEERRLLDAIEELRGAKLAIQPRLQTGSKALQAQFKRLERKVADIEAIGIGPWPPSVAELVEPQTPDAWLLEGLIRPGTTVMLTGPPGSSKSWAARQLAMCAAAGTRIFLDYYPIARPLNVLVVDEDNGPDEEWRRDQALLAHLGLARNQLGRLMRVSLQGVQLDKPEWQAWLRSVIEGSDIDLAVLDPISEMHGGKELREDPAFRSLLQFLKRLKVDFAKLATLLVHHTRKVMPGDRSSSRGMDDVRGQWGQTPDVVALMWPLGERRVQWETHKRVPHSKLILEASLAGPLIAVADESTSRDRRMETDDKVLSAIENGLTSAADISTGTGLSKAGVYKAVGRLAQAGLINKRAPYQMLEGE